MGNEVKFRIKYEGGDADDNRLELYDAGVSIFPFRMTDENMNKHKYSEWYKFWKSLKEGYDFFEKNGHNPPNVKVKNKRYVFEPS